MEEGQLKETRDGSVRTPPDWKSLKGAKECRWKLGQARTGIPSWGLPRERGSALRDRALPTQ